MNLKIQRIYYKDLYIIGKLYLEDAYFCDTLERPWKGNLPDVSCIPAGTYQVKMLFSPHFQRVLPHIVNVENRVNIMIHPANTVDELEGCVAVGKNTVKGGLTSSREYSDLLNQKLVGLENISLTIYI